MKKKKTLKEAITYTPEKELELLEQAKKDLENAKKIYQAYYDRVLALGVDDLINNSESVEQFREKLSQAETAIDKTHSKYFNVVNLYTGDEENNTINELDQVVDSLSDVSYNIMNLETVVGNLIESVEKIKKARF